MIAIKYHTNIPDSILPYMKEYNRVVRMAYSYSRKHKTVNLSEIEKHIKKYNWVYLDATLIKMAVNEAKPLFERPSVIFGSKKLFTKLKYGKLVDKKIWQDSRNSSMFLRGDKRAGGNRKAKLDMLNNRIIFKPKKGISIIICIKHLSKQKKHELIELQKLCDQKKNCFSLNINRTSISILFDENLLTKKPVIKPIHNRIISLDLNPNYIGLVICEKDTVLYKEIIDFKELNNLSSNKKKYEKVQSIHHIISLAHHWHCSAIAIEKLNIKSKNHNKGKIFNRLVNNTWHTELITRTIKKQCVINNLTCIEIMCAYSSIIGCLKHDDVDSIAAALEINHRAQQELLGKRYEVNPTYIEYNQLATRWKKMLTDLIEPGQFYIEVSKLRTWINNLKISYRIVFQDKIVLKSFRLNSYKSGVKLHHLNII